MKNITGPFDAGDISNIFLSLCIIFILNSTCSSLVEYIHVSIIMLGTYCTQQDYSGQALKTHQK
jgi:hypothetical protein